MERILIVDDELSIRKGLDAILRDEGYQTELAADGVQALEAVNKSAPDLVLLDIWMPGLDGMEVLKQIRARYSKLPVVMISGHATIATAISATKHGACDFIEKPLDLQRVLQAVKNAFESVTTQGEAVINQDTVELPESFAKAVTAEGTRKDLLSRVIPLVFARQTARGKRVPQRTLAHSAVLYGQGLHSGKKSGLILEPLPANSGIHFASVSDAAIVPAHLEYVGSTGFATTVSLGGTQVGTIEHLMSAIHAYGISNVLIKCNGEVPVMDGSALAFCKLFEDAGIKEQEGDWYELHIDRPIQIGNEREFIRIEPGEGFTIDYTLDYPAPLGKMRYVYTLGDIEAYKREIAPARTFGFVKDIGALQKQGLALGGRFDNFVLFGPDGPINDKLRFPDEPVRHKILDAIGDLYLLGRKFAGKVTAQMTGHSDNVALLREITRVLG